MMDDALYTTSTPNTTIASTVLKRIQSVLSRCAILFLGWAGLEAHPTLQSIHDLFEHRAAMFEALKLVEAGACGREQNGIAGRCVLVCMGDGRVQRYGIHQRHCAL